MKNCRLLILLFALIGCGITYSQIQPTIPPSPTASALAKYVDNPVSHYTGTPKISIPIHIIELKDFALPISLSYNPQDIKVTTIASDVGLSWSLNAGEVITRAVRDAPDDGHVDYCLSNEAWDNSFHGTIYGHTPCSYGYLYAISDGIPTGPNNSGYLGTTTYDLDLNAIYDN
ncbi:MAG: hypothetical protein AAF600_18650 [Bacteroidota bacterium]